MKNQTPMKTEPSRDVIAQRAREIWKAAGCPEGQDMEHWLQAEAELRTAGQNKASRIVVSPDANPCPRAVRSAEPVKPESQPARLAGGRPEPRLARVYTGSMAAK
jgi:hypothetical protein